MDRFQGLLGIALILGLMVLLSKHRSRINWRIIGAGLGLQVLTCFLVIAWAPGAQVLQQFAGAVTHIIDYTKAGTEFVFGSLIDTEKNGFVFAVQVLPVIIFFGTIVGALYYLRILQWFVEIVGTALKWVLGTSKIESVWASTVVVLGMSEAPLVIQPYLKRLTKSEFFVCMVGGLASVAGTVLVGYSLLGAPMNYLLAAAVMNAPGSLLIAKGIWPETETSDLDASVRDVRDTESVNIIDALSRGALTGGHLAVIVGCLLIAFIAVIALLNGALGGIGGWFGMPDLSFDKVFGWLFAPVAWLIGVPGQDAATAGALIGQKTVLNEFVAFSNFGPMVEGGTLAPKTVLITTFALCGFANFGSIAILVGSLGSLVPERRHEVAKYGLLALLAATMTNLLNAAIVGVVGS